MALKITVSIFVLFTLLSWTSASYVEAVAGAYDTTQTRQNMQIAMACGHFNKFLDPATRQWRDDLTSTCLSEKSDILTYCQKKYPGFDVTNIVEADQSSNITAWCSVDNPEECTTSAHVVPFRCLVGTFESDALVVPSQCRFQHLHEEGTCQTPQQWKKAARNSCRKKKTKLSSTGMLLPCDDQVDMYQGVEFVCCPRSSNDVRERPEDSSPVDEAPSQMPTSVEDSDDPYLRKEDDRDEPQAYEAAKERLASKQREKVAMVMQQYEEAQKKLDPSSKNYAAKKQQMTTRYEDAIGDLEIETEQKQVQLQEVHEARIETNLNDKIDVEEQNYWNALEREPLKSRKILRSFEKYLKAVQKKRKHLISHYKHLRRVDPDKAAKQTDDILSQLKASALRVAGNVDRLQKLPDIYAEIEASIADLQDAYADNEDDTRFIQGVEEEGQGEDEDEDETGDYVDGDDSREDAQEEAEEEADEEEPTGDVPQVTSTQSKVTEGAKKEKTMKPTIQQEIDIPIEGEDGDDDDDDDEEDVEYPTEFRTTLNVPEDETETIPDIPVVVVKPIESYTKEELDVIPRKSFQPMIVSKNANVKDAHSKTEVHVRSKAKALSVDKTISKKALSSTPALAFALACAVVGVAMGLVVAVLVIKKKTRRPPVNQSFTEVDPNLTVEQRHIVSMQQNGYENPTYKYFEMQ